jgi:hypothetical protein
VEDHTNGAPLARIEFADAVVEFHLIVASYPFHRAAVDRKDGRVPFLERQDHRAGLHAGTLLGHHELPAHEVLARLIQQDRELYRKDVFPVEVAMETVVVLWCVLQEQRRRAYLTRPMAAFKKRGVVTRESHSIAHALMPLVGDRGGVPALVES